MCEWKWAASVDLVTVLWGRSRLGLRKLPVVSKAIGSKPVLIKGSGLGRREGSGWGSPACTIAITKAAAGSNTLTNTQMHTTITYGPKKPQTDYSLFAYRDVSIHVSSHHLVFCFCFVLYCELEIRHQN